MSAGSGAEIGAKAFRITYCSLSMRDQECELLSWTSLPRNLFPTSICSGLEHRDSEWWVILPLLGQDEGHCPIVLGCETSISHKRCDMAKWRWWYYVWGWLAAQGKAGHSVNRGNSWQVLCTDKGIGLGKARQGYPEWYLEARGRWPYLGRAW